MEVIMTGWEVPIGAAIAFAGGAIATGIAQSKIGAAGAGTVAERPESAGTVIVLAIPETLVILGFVVAAMIIIMVE